MGVTVGACMGAAAGAQRGGGASVARRIMSTAAAASLAAAALAASVSRMARLPAEMVVGPWDACRAPRCCALVHSQTDT